MHNINKFLIAGVVMVLVMLCFMVFALGHPEFSAGKWIYAVYIVYTLLTVFCLVMAFVKRR